MVIVRANKARRYHEIPHHHSEHFLDTLVQTFELAEIEVGHLAERVQEQRSIVDQLRDREERLSRYIDQLIRKFKGPGEYRLGDELWVVRDNH